MTEKKEGPEKSEDSRGAFRKYEAAKKNRQLFLRAKFKVAERFSVAARQKLGNMLKGVAVIGSLTRGDFTPGSDLDLLVVLDDTQRDVPPELKEKMLAMLNEIARKLDKKAQVQVHTITEMFQFAKDGDNIIYNFLRHMRIVYDGGILKPLKKLLKAGEIKPTKESVVRSMEGAEYYFKKAGELLEGIVERYYRVVTWAGNAFIMSHREPPAAPPEIPIVLKKFADQGVLPGEVPLVAADVIKLHKGIEHGDVKPEMAKVAELQPKVRAYLDLMKKEVLGAVVGEGLKGSMKAKIKTMPKIIYEFKTGRAFVWLLDDGVYMAYYAGEKLTSVHKASVKEGKVSGFAKIPNEALFEAMELSSIKPLINLQLIRMIYSAFPPALKKPVKQVSVEYPGRAMIDLGNPLK